MSISWFCHHRNTLNAKVRARIVRAASTLGKLSERTRKKIKTNKNNTSDLKTFVGSTIYIGPSDKRKDPTFPEAALKKSAE